jgi:hypothetical protein
MARLAGHQGPLMLAVLPLFKFEKIQACFAVFLTVKKDARLEVAAHHFLKALSDFRRLATLEIDEWLV